MVYCPFAKNLIGEKMRSIGSYKLDKSKLLGEGTYSKVYLGYHENEKFPVAIKVIKTKDLNEKELDNIQSEINFYITMKHPHLLKMFDFYTSKHKSEFFIVTEFCSNGDLSK